jgi:phosphomannomutase
MVTGSHIPADRNGLKFYLPNGEISKADEAGISALLDAEPVREMAGPLKDESSAATERYIARFADLLPKGTLSGLRIGVYQHTTVARDLLVDILTSFGADIVPLGRMTGFIPVDTEAFSDPVLSALAGWLDEHRLDAMVSADGDGDRPLLMNGEGQFVRGDVLGLLAARHLGARTVVTPVTSNSGIERVASFDRVVRTKVGSPYVVEAMAAAGPGVVGFEANGGTFVGEGVTARGTELPPLQTRDAVLPLLCALAEAAESGKTLAQMQRELPLMHAMADRLQNVPRESSVRFLESLGNAPGFAEQLFADLGMSGKAVIDGVQIWTGSGAMVHFRASGNAPELRCYVEAERHEEAQHLLDWGMRTAASAVGA